MKKYFTLLMACAAVLAACTKEDDRFGMPSSDPVTISAYIPGDGLTKVSLAQDTANPDGAVKLYWEAGDVITVKNAVDETKSVEFVYKSGAGTTAAQFTAPGGVAALAGATSYNIYLTSHLPGGFASQTQACDGSTAHLGYAATLSGVNAYDGATFSEDWASANGDGTFASSSVLRLRAQLPSAAMADAVQKVIVKASKPIFDEDNELSIAITTPGVEGNSKVVTVYATLPAGDVVVPAGTELLFQFQVSDDVHDKYTAWRKLDAAKTLCAGQVNYFNVNCPSIQSFAGVADDGSEAHPYLIGDRHQMDAMHATLVDESTKYYKMVDDVDLAAINPWQPLIPDADSNRQIFFDGGGHTISHLKAGTAYDYPSFIGFLWGEVSNVVFDAATITCGSSKEQSAGVVSGYIGGSGHQGDCRSVTIKNSSVTSGGAYVGGLGARVGKAGEFRDCHVINTTIFTTTAGTDVDGLLSYIASNATLSITDCSAEDITVTGGGHYAGGLVAQIMSNNPVTILRCHTTGSVTRSSTGRHFGGLVGSIQSADVKIINCYSTCSVTGYQFTGGLVGSWWSSDNFSGGSGGIYHSFASGIITDKGNSGDGGLVGVLDVPGITITNSVAWNSSITPNRYGEANYSSGAVVGRTHPNSHLENNYRKPGMSLTAYWIPSASFDHPDSKKDGGKYYIWKIGADKVEANGGYTTATAFSNPLGLWAYHGKHLDSGITVSPDDKLGFTSSSPLPGMDDTPVPDPENPSYTGNNVWGLGTTETIVDGVTYTNFHGTWEGEIREINIITTTLNDHNKLGIYYNYSDEGLMYLNEKCEYVDAIAGTNGSMTSQFIRVNDRIKRSGDDSGGDWLHNCALTVDGDVVDIVKVDNNADAATLPNHTVSCAGPLLVWKGNKLTASAEWLAADTNRWLTDGKNAGGQPRTAIGINKEGNKLIQVTVDGRWTSGSDAKKAYGMATDLLAELMLQLGCYKAMNLDGGGGSQMWIYGKGDKHNIVNHPHNCWPTYDDDSGIYYWIKENEVGRRKACCAVYIKSDLK